MSAQFVARVLSYSIGKGRISLRGSRKRPWLELKRPETERLYLGSQVYQLRKLHPGALEVFWDRLPTDGFYDLDRARIQTDELWRAYELLYPRDQFTLSSTVLDVAGLQGACSLWLDHGSWYGRSGEIAGPFSPTDKKLIADWLTALGYPASNHRTDGRFRLIMRPEAMKLFIPAIRPMVHQSMRRKLMHKKL
jgi:hypothetical protein